MKIALIYMASGFGKRYGANKLMEYHNGTYLYEYGLQMLCEVKEEFIREGHQIEICVVSNQEKILCSGRKCGKSFQNVEAEEGIGASVRIGTNAAMELQADAAAFFVADQPRLTKESAMLFLREFCKQEKKIGRVTADGKHGNPVVFEKQYFPELRLVSGDEGGRQVIRKHLDDIMYFEVPAEELRDIDYPKDWENISDGR